MIHAPLFVSAGSELFYLRLAATLQAMGSAKRAFGRGVLTVRALLSAMAPRAAMLEVRTHNHPVTKQGGRNHSGAELVTPIKSTLVSPHSAPHARHRPPSQGCSQRRSPACAAPGQRVARGRGGPDSGAPGCPEGAVSSGRWWWSGPRCPPRCAGEVCHLLHGESCARRSRS